MEQQPTNEPVTWPYVMPQSGYLTGEEEKQVAAIFSRIVPRDAARGIPGATDAGAARFVSLLLAMDKSVYDEIPAWQTLYRGGLAALAVHSQQSLGKPLAQLSEEEMDGLLQKLEQGKVENLTLPGTLTQPTVFKTFWRHCLQGCFADPRWGGNKDRIMWRWLGYLQEPEEVL